MHTFRIVTTMVMATFLLIAYNNCSGQFRKQVGAADGISNFQSTAECKLINEEAPIEPTTIEQTVQLINQIQKPVTIPCFLSFLPKPFQIYAVNNAASAQPAAGYESPRIFIFNKNLILSVVPDGLGRDLLEMSLVTDVFRSIKAEIQFPVMGEVLSEEPYLKIAAADGGTSCRGCHEDEVKVMELPNVPAFVSNMALPNSAKRVPQRDLLDFAMTCDVASNAFRCAVLKAVFIDGSAVDAPFLAAPISTVSGP